MFTFFLSMNLKLQVKDSIVVSVTNLPLSGLIRRPDKTKSKDKDQGADEYEDADNHRTDKTDSNTKSKQTPNSINPSKQTPNSINPSLTETETSPEKKKKERGWFTMKSMTFT